MNIHEILASGIINRSELARRMYPTNKDPAARLERKIKGLNNQRLTDPDIAQIKAILSDIFKLT